MTEGLDTASREPPLTVRFEIPRAELERARRAPAGAAFDETHLFGRVVLEINAPLAPDPVLRFLQEKCGLKVEPPIHVALDQPVAYVVGQLASAAVLALHGEGDFTIPLAGGRGALSVASRAGALDLGVPLERYAGVVPLAPAPAAAALGAACASLASILNGSPALSLQPVTKFLEREAKILDAVAKGASGAQAPPAAVRTRWPVDEFERTGAPALATLAAEAEREGAHVVAYWRAERGNVKGDVSFEPIRAAPRPALRGALARLIFPGAEGRLDAVIAGDGEGSRRLRERLRRPAAFSARVTEGTLGGLEEPGGALPMA